uniref:Uncharacterized protein n=1 Tax=Anguilla anguilla TaxID=7936 RepID=A0A0E9UXG9_ANGAN
MRILSCYFYICKMSAIFLINFALHYGAKRNERKSDSRKR